MTSLEIHQEQVRKDREHHAERLAWLSESRPLYADGTPVAAIDAINWKAESERCLADATGMHGLNSAHE